MKQIMLKIIDKVKLKKYYSFKYSLIVTVPYFSVCVLWTLNSSLYIYLVHFKILMHARL